MRCLCGCGRDVPKRAVDFNFQAGEIGVELLAWDKARASLAPDSPDRTTIDRVIGPGASAYRRALLVLHAEEPPGSLEPGVEWLAESRARRRSMSRTRPFIPKGRLKPSEEDFARYDPRRPELTFTGSEEGSAPESAAEDPGSEGVDHVAQLDQLHRLHLEGALTDAEFADAKARLIARM